MASISTDKSGNRTVQFVGCDEKRRSIRLGKVTMRAAEQVKARVEHLNVAKGNGHAIDLETLNWLKTIGPALAEKLANSGLVPKATSATLDTFMAEFIESRTADTKPRTRRKYESTRRRLVAVFGADKLLREISPGDADDFCRKLQAEGQSTNTVRKHVAVAKLFFTAALRKRLIHENPFAGLKSATVPNASRYHFVSPSDMQMVLKACTDDEFRLILALSRYGGLRCPSEHLTLRWSDIDWKNNRLTVHSPKTEHHAGHESRVIPLFPELRTHLEKVRRKTPRDVEYVIRRYRREETNLRTRLKKTIRRAGLEPWPKLFQNLRSTRQTELEEQFPSHVVCKWMGNSRAVAQKHYLQVTEDHFQKAVQNPVQLVHKAVQQAVAGNCRDAEIHVENGILQNAAVNLVAEAGLEPARG